MLVLSREPSEGIVIHIPGRENPVRIVTVAIQGKKVRYGIEADSDIIILRDEVDAKVNPKSLNRSEDSGKGT